MTDLLNPYLGTHSQYFVEATLVFLIGFALSPLRDLLRTDRNPNEIPLRSISTETFELLLTHLISITIWFGGACLALPLHRNSWEASDILSYLYFLLPVYVAGLVVGNSIPLIRTTLKKAEVRRAVDTRLDEILSKVEPRPHTPKVRGAGI